MLSSRASTCCEKHSHSDCEVELHIYFFLLAMNTTRATTWVHFEDSESRTDLIPLGWTPRLTKQGSNQCFSWVEASDWEGMEECLLQLPLLPNLSSIWYCSRVLKKFIFTLCPLLPAHLFYHSPDWEIQSFSSKPHFESRCIVVYAKHLHIYVRICKVWEQFLLWIWELNALVHVTFSMELQSTITNHRIHVSRTQNSSGHINTVTYINTQVRHVCDSFMPHGSFFGTTTEILPKFQTWNYFARLFHLKRTK